MSPRLFVLIFFGGHSFAAVLTTASPSLPTLAAQKREALVTRFSSIWISGDPSKLRTAEIGFDCRVDLDRSLWGFCPTSVFVASDCGLAGNCVDRHACSRGCGKGGGLTTFTCTGTNGEFCTTAELYLTNNIGPFSYIGCGGGLTTDRYSAFTTGSTASLGSKIQATTATLPPTSLSTSLPTQGVNQTGVAANTTSSASSPTPNAASETQSPNNTGAIIGGVVGCLALICVSIVSIVWLLRRHRRKNNSKPPSIQESGTSPPGLIPHDLDIEKPKYLAAEWTPQELGISDRVPVGELRVIKSPVELPAATPYLGK